MKKYEYKSITIESRFRDQGEIDAMDKVLNDSGEKGWELVSTTSLANSTWDEGKTTAILMTFRREKKSR